MGDPLTPQVSERICKHMNEDHADAIALYARVFGQVEGVTQARMQAIDPEGMDLQVQAGGAVQTLRIRFDHPLRDSEDAHHTLVAMVKQARAQVKQAMK
jgi:putative heme iron utilization protein